MTCLQSQFSVKKKEERFKKQDTSIKTKLRLDLKLGKKVGSRKQVYICSFIIPPRPVWIGTPLLGRKRRGNKESANKLICILNLIVLRKFSSNKLKIPNPFPLLGEMSAGYGFLRLAVDKGGVGGVPELA